MEKRKRGRPPGLPRTGGRKPGTKNRVSVEQKDRAERILQLIESQYLESDIEKLNPVSRMTLFKDCLDFVQPRLARINHESNDVIIINIASKTINGNSNQLATLGNSTPAALCAPDGE